MALHTEQPAFTKVLKGTNVACEDIKHYVSTNQLPNIFNGNSTLARLSKIRPSLL